MRVFFAIDPDDVLRQLANDIILKAPFENVGWSKPENLHLTVRFLEHLEENQLTLLCEKIQTALTAIKPFTIEADRTVCFPAKNPKVFGIYFHLNAELAELTRLVREVTRGLGCPEEKRPFLPHLTLGRFKVRPTETIINHFRTTHTLQVNSLVLYKSEPTATGSHYTVLHRFDVGKG
jgi:2'-5' RNA ligase